MNNLFKQQALKDVVKYNNRLLVCCILTSFVALILSIKVLTAEEKLVLIPTHDVDKRIVISSKGYTKLYLQEWAYHVMQTLMTASSDTVDRQVEELKLISANSQELHATFKKHIDFMKGSNVQSVFFPKGAEFEETAVVVSGMFRYWLGSSEKCISQEKSYRLRYKRGPNEIILLKSVEEVNK
jgi:conjugal transfer pilus assembly protein TraE